MARKNLLASITKNELTAVNSDGDGPTAVRPSGPAFLGRGAFGAVTRSIDELAARADAAKDLEARLTAGELIVDIDPANVEASFVIDRMRQHDDENYRRLLEAIQTKGQDSPILVRPHPTSSGRYQVAFGHRRLQAARELERPVRAVVKHLSDRDLVIAQGQENSARADLSFIERARFARSLEQSGYDRETIMLALSVDKTTVSRMISVADRIPEQLIDAIGPAPSVGRDRWLDLSKLSQSAPESRVLKSLVESQQFTTAHTDDRFDMVEGALSGSGSGCGETAMSSRVRARGQARYWSSADGSKVAKITTNDRAFVLAIDRRIAPEFGDYLVSKMDELYTSYSSRTKG